NCRPSTLTMLSLPMIHASGDVLLTLKAFAAASSAVSPAASEPAVLRASSSTAEAITSNSTPAAKSICRRMALDEARIRAKQNNLVDKEPRRPSAKMGTHSIGGLSNAAQQLFEDSPT